MTSMTTTIETAGRQPHEQRCFTARCNHRVPMTAAWGWVVLSAASIAGNRRLFSYYFPQFKTHVFFEGAAMKPDGYLAGK